MKGLLLSGGKGTRLRPITHTGPKQLIPVANKPVLLYAIEHFKEAGITEIGVVLGNKGREEIQELLGDGSAYGVDITYIVQGNPLGIAHAVGCAREFIDGDDFVVYLGDNMLKKGLTDLVSEFNSSQSGAGIALQSVEDPQQFGVAELDADGTVTGLVEKPDDPPSEFALIGIYVFSAAVFDVIAELEPSWRGELEITDAIQGLLDRGHEIDSHIVEGWWKDTGKPADILHANRLVLEDIDAERQGTIEDGADVTGTIDLHAGAVIEAGATVRGPVSIGADTRVEAGTYVGPFTSIGEESVVSNIQIQNSVVVGGAELTANETIVDSLLGRGTTISSAEDLRPEGTRLVIGEHSNLKL